jgi:hypothetical protein
MSGDTENGHGHACSITRLFLSCLLFHAERGRVSFTGTAGEVGTVTVFRLRFFKEKSDKRAHTVERLTFGGINGAPDD